ncbi:MAG: hypothetical protein M3R43_06975 [Acidobacteriota bacterium]|nr:hypothetical protein [Acidobacteriota bacterium]
MTIVPGGILNNAKNDLPTRFRGSPLARVLGATLLGIIVLAYLILITLSQRGEFSTRAAVRLGIIWIIGLVALGLLARGWRKAKAQLDLKNHGDQK